MKQAAIIALYNATNRPQFNTSLFRRNDNDLITALRDVIMSCQRDTPQFTIKITDFSVIEDYDTIQRILWAYSENMNKFDADLENMEMTEIPKNKENFWDYISLRDSDFKIIKIQYYLRIIEKKGEATDTLTTYVVIPRIVDDFYFKLNGNMFSAMYQIVDASTYNNSAAKNARTPSVTLKVVFQALRVYRYNNVLRDIYANEIPATYYTMFAFSKHVLATKYMLAKFGLKGACEFLKVVGLQITDTPKPNPTMYIFKANNLYIHIPKFIYNSNQIAQSLVYTVQNSISHLKDDVTCKDVYGNKFWVNILGGDFVGKNVTNIYTKGLQVLTSFEGCYDEMTKKDLHLRDEDKRDSYCLLRWLMYEFNALRSKDNLDISTKKLRWAEYIAALYAMRLAAGIFRIADKGDKADMTTIKKALSVPPLYLIKSITKCQLVNYKDCVNDLDALTALKYTYKGPSGIGESSNAISTAYRHIHPSHIGRVDLDSSSNSDPGVSGTLCPLAQIYDNHFTQFEEPSTWSEVVDNLINKYNSMNGKIEMCRLITDSGIKQTDTSIASVASAVAKSMVDIVIKFDQDQRNKETS